jgi:hypothetical protein
VLAIAASMPPSLRTRSCCGSARASPIAVQLAGEAEQALIEAKIDGRRQYKQLKPCT